MTLPAACFKLLSSWPQPEVDTEDCELQLQLVRSRIGSIRVSALQEIEAADFGYTCSCLPPPSLSPLRGKAGWGVELLRAHGSTGPRRNWYCQSVPGDSMAECTVLELTWSTRGNPSLCAASEGLLFHGTVPRLGMQCSICRDDCNL